MVDFPELVGASAAMEAVRHDVRRLVALARDGRRLPAVLIRGETGTGKGLLARVLHRYGPRAGGPFVDVNCAAIPETLLEGELFGYERGAFTDARRAKPGLFQASSGGVLFLDEIGLLPEALQAKLLTAIDEGAVRRLGSTTKETFDGWLISATNADLEQAVRARRFREDLYHRVAVLTIQLPPLRDRDGDAVLLADGALERACRDYGLPRKSLAPDARALVARSPWPGNVRQLANVVERLALLVDRSEVRAADVEAALGTDADRPPRVAVVRSGDGEREQLVEALEATGWNIMRTAARLGVSRNTVRARMDRLGLRGRREAGAAAEPGDVPARLPPAAPVAPGTAVHWERRHVTFVRVVAGDARETPVDTRPVLSLAVDKAVGFGGRVEALGRASLDVSFGAVTLENAARRAASAALAIRNALPAGPTDVPVRIVIHTEAATVAQSGDAIVVDERDRTVITSALDSLLRVATPDSVHVGAATKPFLERHFELRAAADAPTPATFTIVRADPSGLGAWRTMTRFSDRDAETQLLRSRWDLTVRGRGQAVGIVGEAGVGKSRLLLEFTRGLPPGEATVVRVAVATSEAPSRTRPAASLLAALFGLGPADNAAEIRGKLATRLRTLDLEPALLAPLTALADVEMDDRGWAETRPEQRVRRMMDALRRVVVRESIVRPLVVVLEDVHWADADTQAAIEDLVAVVPTSHILLLLAYRDEYRHQWTGKTFFTQIRLDPLPDTAVEQMLEDLLGDTPAPADLKRRLATWTDGNPFFLEEGVRTLREHGALTGGARAAAPGDEIVASAIPATVEDTLAARIHRLAPAARYLLQCASAIGTEFDDALLAAVAELPSAEIDGILRTLEDAEFVYRLAAAAEPTHTFKHALTHLVTYRSVPADEQRTMHARILATLEARGGGLRAADVDVLAEHAVRGELWPKAVTYLQQAGARALARSANRAAADHLERAIVALERMGDGPGLAEVAVDIRLALRHALTPLGDVERILHHLRDAQRIAERAGDRRRLGRIASFETNALFSHGQHAAAIASGERARAIARELGDAAMAVAAEQFVGRALHAQGRYRAAVEIFAAVVASMSGPRASENLGLPVPPAIFARSHLVVCLAELGDFDDAEREGVEAMRLAGAIGEAVGGAEAMQWACYPVGLLAIERGDFAKAVTVLEAVLRICRGSDLPVYLPRTQAALGHAEVLLGRADNASVVEHAVADAERLRQVNVHTTALVRLADAYRHLGQTDRAMMTADHAVALARERGERGTEVRALRLLAGAYHRAGGAKLHDAETLYRSAAAIADELDMRPQSALCRLGLGTVCGAIGDFDEARAALRSAESEARRLGLAAVATEAARALTALD